MDRYVSLLMSQVTVNYNASVGKELSGIGSVDRSLKINGVNRLGYIVRTMVEIFHHCWWIL